MYTDDKAWILDPQTVAWMLGKWDSLHACLGLPIPQLWGRVVSAGKFSESAGEDWYILG